MEKISFVLDYFFNWSTFSGFCHFAMLAFLCWLAGGPCKININTVSQEDGTGNQQQGETTEND